MFENGIILTKHMSGVSLNSAEYFLSLFHRVFMSMWIRKSLDDFPIMTFPLSILYNQAAPRI